MSSLHKMMRILPDRVYLQLMYWKHFGRFINFRTPQTFNEKLQWLKLYDRRPEYRTMVDKYLVKNYVSRQIGEEYTIPTLGVWDRAEDIDFSALPERFVLKCNNDSGGIVICRDKSTLDQTEAIAFLKKRLNNNGFWYGREWPYKNMKPRILAEEYMEDEETGELRDYKFFCFNGTAKAMLLVSGRYSTSAEEHFDFYDSEGCHLPFTHGWSNADVPPSLPTNFSQMKQLAQKLAAGIPHVRVDFYK